MSILNAIIHLTGGNDGCVRIWDIKSSRLLNQIGPISHPNWAVLYGNRWEPAPLLKNSNNNNNNSTTNKSNTNNKSTGKNKGDEDGDEEGEESKITSPTTIDCPGIWMINEEEVLSFYSIF